MRTLAALLGVGALALLWSRQAGAAINPDPGYPAQPAEPAGDGWELFPGDWWGWDSPAPVFDDPGAAWPVPGDDMQPVYAFLYMIRRAEHTAASVANGNDWRTFYGGSLFNDLTDHPVLTGEKRGVPLPPDWCIAAGYSPGCVSTAAGAFQITKPTWQRVRGRYPRLADFSPSNQEQAAIRLLDEKGIVSLIKDGRIEDAIYRASPIWASLPRSANDPGAVSSSTQQGRKSPAVVMGYFNAGLTMA